MIDPTASTVFVGLLLSAAGYAMWVAALTGTRDDDLTSTVDPSALVDDVAATDGLPDRTHIAWWSAAARDLDRSLDR